MELGLDELVKGAVSGNLLSATTDDLKLLKFWDYDCCGSNPIDENKCYDLSAVIKAYKTISQWLKSGDLVVINYSPSEYMVNILFLFWKKWP